jgi:hypothetical protein
MADETGKHQWALAVRILTLLGDKDMPKKKKTNKRPDRSLDMATSKRAMSVTDPEVQQEFREMSRFRTRRGRISEDEDLSGGEVDTAAREGEEEAVGGSAALPDQDMFEDIGRAAGLTYQDNEELDPAEKVRNGTASGGSSTLPHPRTTRKLAEEMR